MENLSIADLQIINGGGLYRIWDYDCDGNLHPYLWDSETGQCYEIIGREKSDC